jgi:MFS family permease
MNNLKVKIGVVSMASLAMSGTVISSAIAAISHDFPTVPISTIQLLSTLPGLGSLIITLIAGQMAMHISKKTLILIGVALVTLGGVIPAFWNSSIIGLLLCSVILGTGIGFISTLNPMILSEQFEGEERSSMMGVNTGTTSLGMMLLTGIGGILGGQNWRHLYWVFLIGVVVFILVLVCLPKDEVIKEVIIKDGKKKKTSTFTLFKNINLNAYVIIFIAFLLGLSYTAYMANLSIVVAERGVGGTAMTGIIGAVGTFGGIFAGFGLKYIRKLTKPNTLAFGFLFLLIALVITCLFASPIVLMIASIFSGMSMVMVLATCPFLLSMVSRPSQIPLVMSIYAFVNSLSAALAPKLISMLHIPAGIPSFIFAGVVCLVVAVVLILTQFGKKAESGQMIPEIEDK